MIIVVSRTSILIAIIRHGTYKNSYCENIFQNKSCVLITLRVIIFWVYNFAIFAVLILPRKFVHAKWQNLPSHFIEISSVREKKRTANLKRKVSRENCNPRILILLQYHILAHSVGNMFQVELLLIIVCLVD